MAKRTVATTDLLKWLRRAPQPKYVLADDKRVDVPKTHAPWPQLADTLTALDPSKITACAEDGAILRARPFGDGSDDDDDDGQVVDVDNVTLKNTGAVLTVFAKLIAEGYDKGSTSSQPLLNNALAFIERQGQQIARLDAIVERLRLTNAKLQAEVIALSGQQVVAGDGENDPLNALVAGVLQGQLLQQQQQAAPPQQTNGKVTRGQPRRAK